MNKGTVVGDSILRLFQIRDANNNYISEKYAEHIEVHEFYIEFYTDDVLVGSVPISYSVIEKDEVRVMRENYKRYYT